MTSEQRALTHPVASTPRKWLIGAAFLVAGVLAAAAGWYYGLGGSAGNRDAAALFAVTLPDAQGKPESIGQWKGHVLVVNFWATWCGPCREEMPEFVRAQQELGAKGLQFVGIAVDSADKVGQFADEIQLNYPALVGGYGALELSRTMGNSAMALPFTVIIDREGRVAHTQLGPLRDAKLRSIVSALL
jgi:thiol-disulfide isomerase/thioredoxin